MLKKIGNRYKNHHLLDWVQCKIGELSSRMPSGDRLLSVNWAKRSLYLWHEFGSTWLIVKVKYLCFGSHLQIPVWLDWLFCLKSTTAPPCVQPSQTYFALQEVQTKSKVCANVFCGAGRECAVNEKGEPSCLCIEVSVGSLLLRKEAIYVQIIDLDYKLPLVSLHIHSLCTLFLCRAVSPTRGQYVAAMVRPTGITVSSTEMLVWLAWRSKWHTTDTARVRITNVDKTVQTGIIITQSSLEMDMEVA